MALSQVGLIPATSFGPWGLTAPMKKSKWARFGGKFLLNTKLDYGTVVFQHFYHSRAPFPSCFELGPRFYNPRAKRGLHFVQARDKVAGEKPYVSSPSPPKTAPSRALLPEAEL